MSSTIIAIKKKASNLFIGYIKLSSVLPVDFQESKIELNSIVIGDDATISIQNLLNGGNKKILWDVAVSLSNSLFVDSLTRIKVLSGKGAVMRNAVNRPMFTNKNHVFSNNADIIDHDIEIDGGIWNGNSSGQTKKGTPQFGFNNIFSWYGVNNLVLKNHKMYTPKTYAQHAINVTNGHLSDFVVDVGPNPAINMDGVHWDGWCKDCSIKRGNIRSYDDGIGMNADDLLNASGSEALGFFPIAANGPISNITIEDIVFNDSLFGIRILSGQSRIDNISIKNISGVTYNYSILVDNYWQLPNNLDKPGKGNVGTVTIDNVTTIVPTKNPGFTVNKGKINLSCSIENFVATNISPSGTENPLVFKLASAGGYAYAYVNVSVNGNQV
ncbi:hypothetical protein [Chryseobacterium arthrosphaerae]|uniref:hypothetical protein n=1 Tax=Chryseobacterium arthrosphaerae TaxID=651561 RepID=UPI00241CBECE|nr:hypothetical protein [Chryseobacterium arthrosphaerae]